MWLIKGERTESIDLGPNSGDYYVQEVAKSIQDHFQLANDIDPQLGRNGRIRAREDRNLRLNHLINMIVN